MEKIMTPNQMRARAKKLEAEGGNRDLINKLLDDANDAERKAYEADKKTGKYKEGGMTMVKKDGNMVPDFAADGKGKMAKGGDVGMHRMPDGKMMKDSAHKGMKHGGKVGHSDAKKDAPVMQKVAAKAVKGHEKRMHDSKKMATGGAVKGYGAARGSKACKIR
tara:strand:- start:164 stop:652 length:489 start_codon:yes stop_codon:yes gene_type:complete